MEIIQFNRIMYNTTYSGVFNQKSLIKKSILIRNYSNVLKYICDDMYREHKLKSYLKKQLTKIFGKHDSKYDCEYFYYVWTLQFDNEIFQIFTNKSQGSYITIFANIENVNEENNKSKTCIAFLKKLEMLLDSVKVK